MTKSMSAAIAVVFLLLFSSVALARDLAPTAECGAPWCLDAIESRDGTWIVRVSDERGVFQVFETNIAVEIEMPELGIGHDPRFGRSVDFPSPPPGGTGPVSESASSFGYQNDEFGIYTFTVTATYVDYQLVDFQITDSFAPLPGEDDPGDDEEN